MVFNTNESSFASPKYPLNYPDDVSCSYRISGPVGSRIALVFSNFALESSAGCTKDRLEIYNGIDAAGTMIARRCGRNTTQFSWNGNKLFLRFITDASVNDEGFLIHFYIGQLGKLLIHSSYLHSLVYSYIHLEFLKKRICLENIVKRCNGKFSGANILFVNLEIWIVSRQNRFWFEMF